MGVFHCRSATFTSRLGRGDVATKHCASEPRAALIASRLPRASKRVPRPSAWVDAKVWWVAGFQVEDAGTESQIDWIWSMCTGMQAV